MVARGIGYLRINLNIRISKKISIETGHLKKLPAHRAKDNTRCEECATYLTGNDPVWIKFHNGDNDDLIGLRTTIFCRPCFGDIRIDPNLSTRSIIIWGAAVAKWREADDPNYGSHGEPTYLSRKEKRRTRLSRRRSLSANSNKTSRRR